MRLGESWAGRIWAKHYISNKQQTWAEAEVTQNSQPSPSLRRWAQIDFNAKNTTDFNFYN